MIIDRKNLALLRALILSGGAGRGAALNLDDRLHRIELDFRQVARDDVAFSHVHERRHDAVP
jgi:hypothetical protein